MAEPENQNQNARSLLKELVNATEENSKELISMNSSLKSLVDTLVDNFEDQKKFIKLAKSKELEKTREGGIGGAFAGIGDAASGFGDAASGFGTGFGSILSGFGAGVSGIGIGGGALAAGLGVLAGGAGYLLEQIGEMDADAIVENVNTLLSIGDSFEGGNWEFLLEGGTFFLAMTGIGAGLAVFGAGAGIAAAVDYFTSGTDWAQSIKDNVITLLSISEELGGAVAFIGEGAAFLAAMTGISAGLAVFGVGSGIAAAVDYFSAEGWAQSIKDNVITLLSISEELGGALAFIGESAAFLGAMTGISAGLAVFSAGSGIAAAVDYFSAEGWAQSIKDNVITLLSISEELGGAVAFIGESATFFLAMTGIGAGLAVFGVGSGIANAVGLFSGEGWAQTIKDNVDTLLSISSGDVSQERAEEFVNVMSTIAEGLTRFAAGQFVGTLATAAESIIGFFTGGNNPFDQIMSIASNAEELERGSAAIDQIANALNTFASIRINDIDLDFENMAQNLAEAIPLLQGLAQGGEVGEGFFDGPNIDFGNGILDPDLRLDELAVAAGQINYILSGGASVPDVSGISNSPTSSEAESLSLENVTATVPENAARLGESANRAEEAMRSSPVAVIAPTVNSNQSSTNVNAAVSTGQPASVDPTYLQPIGA